MYPDQPTIKIIAGDLYEVPLTFKSKLPDGTFTTYDISKYTSFESQWRITQDDTFKHDLTITVVDSNTLGLTITPDITRKMLGPGVIDIQALPGPITIASFNVETVEDVTR